MTVDRFFQRVINLLIFLFVGYVGYMVVTRDGSNTPSIDRMNKAASIPLVLNATPITGRISDALKARLDIEEIKSGVGAPIVCGDKVDVDYVIYMPDGKVLESTLENNQPLSLRVGEGKVIKGLELGVLGMQLSSGRQIAVPARYAFDDPKHKRLDVPEGTSIGLQLKIVGVVPAEKPHDMNLKIYRDKDVAEGEPTLCGDTVHFNAWFYSVQGVALEANVPEEYWDGEGNITFKIGEGSAPLGLEQGLEGMRVGEKRTLIIPPHLLKPRDPKSTFVLEGEEIVFAEVTLVSFE